MVSDKTTPSYSIDVVIIWVDGNDPGWVKEKSKHLGVEAGVDSGARRYRDWDNLQFIFRGIEQFMPWVRNVYFVTSGHKPSWLNLRHKKLKFIAHDDYIPREFLPTFSSHPIELNFHRIRGLSNRFIYFNDDMFITNTTSPGDFFSAKGLPRDMAINTRITSTDYNDPIGNIALNNTSIINAHFRKNEVLRKNPMKWLHPSYGISALFRSISFMPYPTFTGFLNTHLPSSFLKSSFVDVWEAEPAIMSAVCSTKFRSKSDVSQYLIRDWQIAQGNFAPKNWYRDGRYYGVSAESIGKIEQDIIGQKYKLICLNDEASDPDFEDLRDRIISALEIILPTKSSFEL